MFKIHFLELAGDLLLQVNVNSIQIYDYFVRCLLLWLVSIMKLFVTQCLL
jgi:hypothetical protein